MLLAALFVPLIFSPLWGWDGWRTIGPLTSVVVLAVVFVFVESRTRDPILDLGLFRRSRVFAAANTASLLFMAASYGVTIFTAVFLEVVQGRSAQSTGLILLDPARGDDPHHPVRRPAVRPAGLAGPLRARACW